MTREEKRRRQRLRANTLFALFCAALLLTGYLLGRVTATATPTYPERVRAVSMPEPMDKAGALPRWVLHGSCRITSYCSCERCCGQWASNRPLDQEGNPIVYGASGNVLTPGVSVACSLPYGTEIKIDGLPGTYIVEDRTAEWIQDRYAGMTVDIYMDDHEACYDLLAGLPEWMDVYILEESV